MNIDPAILARLPADAELTVTVRVGDLRKAMDIATPGPERVSTTWCARELGYSSRKWRTWCEEGRIAGADKDEGGTWRLPNRAAREHLASVLSGSSGEGPAAAARRSRRTPPAERKRRGPWKLRAIEGGG